VGNRCENATTRVRSTTDRLRVQYTPHAPHPPRTWPYATERWTKRCTQRATELLRTPLSRRSHRRESSRRAGARQREEMDEQTSRARERDALNLTAAELEPSRNTSWASGLSVRPRATPLTWSRSRSRNRLDGPWYPIWSVPALAVGYVLRWVKM
jgi:hypothetical protein